MANDTDFASLAATGAAGREIELKLCTEPECLARLLQHPGLTALAAGPPVVRRQTTTYYDTPDLRLAAKGVAFRVRQEDDGRICQTVKTLNSVAAGDNAAVAVRREWEWPLPDDNPDFRVLTARGVDQLLPVEALPDLQPIFASEIRRTTLLVRPDALSAIEVAFDVGVVRCGSRLHPICEIELELRAGALGPLFDLALELQGVVPLRIAADSKAEIGYRLATGRPYVTGKSEPMALSPATGVAEAFRHIVRHCLRHLLANEDCALAALTDPTTGDIAAVRYLRHGLRRLRHALMLFAPVIASPDAAGFAEQCRMLGRLLAPARDWSMVGPVLRQAGVDVPDGAPIPGADCLAALEATKRARAAILAPEFTRLVLACGGWLEQDRWSERAGDELVAKLAQSITDYAGPWLDQTFRRVRKVDFVRADPAEVKELRRRVRHLLYAAEAFRGLYMPAASRPFLTSLAELRAGLDEVNDLRKVRDLLKTNTARNSARDARLERAFREASARLLEAANRFRDVQPFWKRG
ncbi:MAG: CHAD domain-containing protein [Rhodospirillaceae bacterium]